MSVEGRNIYFGLALVTLLALLTACPGAGTIPPPDDPVRFIKFEADPAAINQDEVTTLSWDLEILNPDATVTCLLSSMPEGEQATEAEEVLCKDSVEVLPEISTTYRLEASTDKRIVFGKSIIVLVTAITEFTADQNEIQRGETVTLKWQAVNSESCFITFKPERGSSTEPKEVKCKGSQTFTPDVTTLYRFSALGADGETFIEDNLNIIVNP